MDKKYGLLFETCQTFDNTLLIHGRSSTLCDLPWTGVNNFVDVNSGCIGYVHIFVIYKYKTEGKK